MLLVALLFFAGHYCVYAMPLDLSREICLVSISALLGVCLFGVVFLLTDSRGIRSCRIFALQILLVGFASGLYVMQILMQKDIIPVSSQFISPEILIYGNVYAFIMLMYPLGLLYPGRMTFGKYLKLFLPALLTGLLYYGYTRLMGYQIAGVDSWQALWTNFHKFDVWFVLAVVAYPIWMFVVVMYQKKRYISWYCKSYSAESDIDLGWLDYYLFGYFMILISYMIVVPMHNPHNTLAHSIYVLIFFGYSFYHILRQETPAVSNVFVGDISAESAQVVLQSDSQQSVCTEACTMDDKYRFVDKIPEFKIVLEQWMQTEKPYLNKDFKLLDVMQALPLNRSYLSRMFNEAYGETFFSFIMRYRIEESIHLLETRPDLTITHIAQICGFSSASVFGRAFLKNRGMTPKEYRNR